MQKILVVNYLINKGNPSYLLLYPLPIICDKSRVSTSFKK
jgi:hypothetical protein